MPQIRVKTPDGNIIRFPEGTDEATINSVMQEQYGSAQSEQPAAAPARNPRFDVSQVIAAGQNIDESGIATQPVSQFQQEGFGVSDAQREYIANLQGFQDDAPVGSKSNPYVVAAHLESGKTPRVPVGQYYVDPDGRLQRSEADRSHMLGFTTATRRATNNIGARLGIPFFENAREQDNKMLQRARLSGVEPSIAGEITGSTIGTLPYLVATRNPGVAGGIAGGLNSQAEIDDLEGLATDTAIGAAGGKVMDKAIGAVGAVIAPRVRDAANRMLQAGVELTPGQIRGGVLQKFEDAATSIPLIDSVIKGAQRRSMESFNRAAVDDVLEPLRRGRPQPQAARNAPDEDVVYRAERTGTSAAPEDVDIPPGQRRFGRRQQALPPPDDNMLPPPSAGLPAGARGTQPPASGGTPPLRGRTENPSGGPSTWSFPNAGRPRNSDAGALDDALEGLDTALPSDIKAGSPAVEHAYNIIREGYDRLIPRLSVQIDDTARNEFKGLMDAASGLPPAQKSAMRDLIQGRVIPRFDAQGRSSGQSYKELDSILSSEIREYTRALDPDQRKYGQAVRELQRIIRSSLARSNPNHAATLGALDESYARLLRVEDAASKSAGGIFTPQALKTSIRTLDSSGRKRATAHGNSMMQEMAEAGLETLSKTVPDSGTATRALVGTGILAGLTNTLPTISVNPLISGGLLAGLSPYMTRGTSRLTARAMGVRPDWLQRLRAPTEATARPIARATTAPALVGPTEEEKFNPMLRGRLPAPSAPDAMRD